MKTLHALLLLVFLLFTPFANAVNVQVTDNPANPDTSGPCTLVDGDGGFIPATSVLTVSTPAESGNALLKCKGKVLNTSKQAVIYNNNTPGYENVQCDIFQDGNYIGSTWDWQETVSASGQATLTCHY